MPAFGPQSPMSDPYAPPGTRVADIGASPSRIRSALVLTRAVAVAGCVILFLIPVFDAFSARLFGLALTALLAGIVVFSLATLVPLFSGSRHGVLVWLAILLNGGLLALGGLGMVTTSPRQPAAFYGMLLYILPATVNLFALFLLLALRRAPRVRGWQP